ncbi:MAG: Cytochrome c protein [Gammaproteobacteria bacterium]|nr:Cytochrome c protein [Gammaproteobacteria bacterium]
MLKKSALICSIIISIIIVFIAWLLMLPSVPDIPIPKTADAFARGQYLVHAGGCISCHAGIKDRESLSGGLALNTDFGTFYAPNITPSVATGIGGWGGRDFLLALKHGRHPDGGYYFPAFPYRAYSGLTDQDVLDIGAWLMVQPPVEAIVPEHELPGWLSSWQMAGWNLLADLLQANPVPESDPVLVRGAYLVRNLGHCGECHTPRNRLGIPDVNREFTGTEMGDHKVEAIDAIALAGWTGDDITALLSLGILPDGEFVGGDMAKVVDHNTSRLTDADRSAIAAFLKR